VSEALPAARPVVAGKIGTTLLCCYLLAVALRIRGCYGAEARVRDELPDAGPRVGETFPAFTLPDVSGTRISLQDLAGRPAALVFVPSLDWSAPTKARVLDLAEAVGGRRDVTLAVVLTAGAATPRSLRFAREHAVPAYFLVDGTGLTDHLGVTTPGPENAPVALPATFVLDASGRVVLRDVRRDPRAWLDPDVILTAAGLSPQR
jgi:peroxiredoxin